MTTKSNNKWELITNFEIERLAHILLCCKATKLKCKISKDAYDVYGNIVPDSYALYVPVENYTTDIVEPFWQFNFALQRKYREYLLNNGYTEDGIGSKSVFVDCEKYW